MNRFWLALRAFWRILVDPAFAERAGALFTPAREGPDLRILALLQRDGRLIDFLKEDLEGYGDAQIGAAARDIHRGCRKALEDYLTIEPVVNQAEDSPINVPSDFDPARIRLVGNVTGSPPFRGVLKHHGWLVQSERLPALPASPGPATVLSAAEVEIP